QVLALEGIQIAGAASLSTRAEERGARLWGGPDRTAEMGLGSAWAGGAFELSIELRGHVALHLAARALDAALLLDLAARAGRTGAAQGESTPSVDRARTHADVLQIAGMPLAPVVSSQETARLSRGGAGGRVEGGSASRGAWRWRWWGAGGRGAARAPLFFPS